MEAPAGERRIVAALIADIADSTAIGERLGPERSKFLLDEVLRELPIAEEEVSEAPRSLSVGPVQLLHARRSSLRSNHLPSMHSDSLCR
jgi:hypothetical protein